MTNSLDYDNSASSRVETDVTVDRLRLTRKFNIFLRKSFKSICGHIEKLKARNLKRLAKLSVTKNSIDL